MIFWPVAIHTEITFGWHLLPALERIRAGSALRDGDVVVADPDAAVTWDVFGNTPPSFADVPWSARDVHWLDILPRGRGR